jgi:glycosyltransferase involved in cell wall biosynthesis
MTKPLLSIVIPIFNSEQSIPELFEWLDSVFKREQISYEVIAVNDGSLDNSWEVLKQSALRKDNISIINLDRNYGQQSATLCGLLQVNGDYAVTIDDDLEYHPEDILTLLFAIKKTNIAMVYGYAEKKGRSKLVNYIAGAAKWMIYSFSGLSPKLSSFRIIKHDALKDLTVSNSYYFLVDGLLKRNVKSQHSYINVKQNQRKYGKSNYTFKSLVVAWIRFLYSSSRFGALFAMLLLAVNILLLLSGYLWLALALGILAIISTLLTVKIKWMERVSFVIKEKLPLEEND